MTSPVSPPSPPPFAPTLNCRPLPPFEPSNLAAVREAFRLSLPCSMQQGWRQKPEPAFAPASIRTGWQEQVLLVFAEMTDLDIFTGVTGLNQRAWELGDTFEMFLRPADQAAYVELHVTPNNQRLQLRFANAAALEQVRQSGSLQPALVPGEVFRSTTWLQPEAQRWFVLAQIPAETVGAPARPLAGSQWRFSFSRYDYTRARSEPVISSTSPHAEPNFHRQQEWGWLNFLA